MGPRGIHYKQEARKQARAHYQYSVYRVHSSTSASEIAERSFGAVSKRGLLIFSNDSKTEIIIIWIDPVDLAAYLKETMEGERKE